MDRARGRPSSWVRRGLGYCVDQGMCAVTADVVMQKPKSIAPVRLALDELVEKTIGLFDPTAWRVGVQQGGSGRRSSSTEPSNHDVVILAEPAEVSQDVLVSRFLRPPRLQPRGLWSARHRECCPQCCGSSRQTPCSFGCSSAVSSSATISTVENGRHPL